MMPVSLDCPFLIAPLFVGQSRMDNPEKLASLGSQDKGRKQTKGQSRMDNPEKLASLGTQDTGRKQTKG
jgi:hypothetical protein